MRAASGPRDGRPGRPAGGPEYAAVTIAAETTSRTTLRPAFAGAAATLSGVGLSRFAYVPLFPAMVAAGWVTGAEAGLLGALNLTGYLAGALGGRFVARRTGTARALDLAMALAVLSCLGCAWNGGAAWLALWRGGSGIAGGILMALAGPAVQGAVEPGRRGLAAGIVMTGVGSGVVIGSLGVPLFLAAGVAGGWLGLAAVIALVWLLARRAWPQTAVASPTGRTVPGAWALCISYGVSGAGLVPHMVYFADHVIRGRGFDPVWGNLAWLLFGIGALVGPVASGHFADRLGATSALRLWLGLQVVALALAFGQGPALLAASALLAGFAAIGMTTIALARARELLGPASGLIWVQATAAFAIAQAATGFGYAALFARTHSHDALFLAGLALSVAAILPVLGRQPAPVPSA